MPVHTDDHNEYFDTYTEGGEKLTPERRSIVHANGIWHRAVNVLLYRSSGELVLQQRAAEKSVCPLAWDLSVAEHLQINESWEAAAHRGLQEELGITNIVLSQCGPEIQGRHDDDENNIHNYEFQRCFQGISDAELTLDPAEVADVRTLSIPAFAREAQATPEQFTPWLIEWAQLIELIDTPTSNR